MNDEPKILRELQDRFRDVTITNQATQDDIPTLWVSKDIVRDVLRFLKTDVDNSYRMLYDLAAIDERVRMNRRNQPLSDAV